MTQLVQSYAYLHPSAARESTAGRSLTPETSGGAISAGKAANPDFFSGFLTARTAAPTAAPTAAATALLTVADVPTARCHRSNAGASLDPVVTADGDRLRFEAFSGCWGVRPARRPRARPRR